METNRKSVLFCVGGGEGWLLMHMVTLYGPILYFPGFLCVFPASLREFNRGRLSSIALDLGAFAVSFL